MSLCSLAVVTAVIFGLTASNSVTDASSFPSRQLGASLSRAFGPRRSRQENYPDPFHNSDHDDNAANRKSERQRHDAIFHVKRSTRHRRPALGRDSRGGATTIAHPETFWYFLKVGLSGGIAGAVGSAALYPMDAAKTLRQSRPSDYKSVFQALGALAFTRTTNGEIVRRTWHLQNVYRGVIPATLGAIPSSALYFGAYESMKTLLTRRFPLEGEGSMPKSQGSSSRKVRPNTLSNRVLVHALAAMSGNVLSSAVFVPKELIKQQLQFRQSGNALGVVVDILATKGLGGLYLGYKATLMRNIPTAVLRFGLYEEFRYRWYTQQQKRTGEKDPQVVTSSAKFFLAGAAAGVIASGLMTPVDVLKTRLATGTCPIDVRICFLSVIKEEGFVGLYSGAGSRMFFSGAFSAIGFSTFEWAKSVLGVSSSSITQHEGPRQQPKSATKAIVAIAAGEAISVKESERAAKTQELARNS